LSYSVVTAVDSETDSVSTTFTAPASTCSGQH
jgi:hypothetical protein